MEKYESRFLYEASIDSEQRKVMDMFYQQIEGSTLSNTVKSIAKKLGKPENEILMILQSADI